MPDDTPTRSQQIEARIDRHVGGAIALNMAPGNMLTIAPKDMAELFEFAKMMAVAGECIPKAFRDKPGACLAIALQAFRTGADPFAVANKAYLVNDRIAYEAQYIHAVVNTSGMLRRRLRATFKGEGVKRRCIIVGDIVGELEPFEYESPEFDKIPVKNSPLWKNDPDQQFFYYASRAWARRYLPEVILGMDTGGDLEERGQMKDITPPPRPTREALQNPRPAETDEAGAEPTEADVEEIARRVIADSVEHGSPTPTYEITEGDGVVYDTDLDEVENHLFDVFKTAQLNGPKAIEAAIENNEPTVDLIRQDGHHELANKLSIEIAQMRRLLQSAKPKRRRATKAEMAERARLREGFTVAKETEIAIQKEAFLPGQNPADGPQAQSPAVVSPQTAALPPGASPAPPPEAATPTQRASYALPMVFEGGKPALHIWAHVRLLDEIRKAKTADEIQLIQDANREHIAAYKATLTPMGGVAFQKDIDDIAKEIRG
jgi:hypothetical protein